MLRALGFPRLISMENFRSPNFPLVAEILTWVTRRFDPSADLPTDVDTEQDRVIFVRSVAQYMVSFKKFKLSSFETVLHEIITIILSNQLFKIYNFYNSIQLLLKATKAHVKLNTKKLYQADGFAVQEILKALSLLYGALQSNEKDMDILNEEGEATLNFDVSNKVRKIKIILQIIQLLIRSWISTLGTAKFLYFR